MHRQVTLEAEATADVPDETIGLSLGVARYLLVESGAECISTKPSGSISCVVPASWSLNEFNVTLLGLPGCLMYSCVEDKSAPHNAEEPPLGADDAEDSELTTKKPYEGLCVACGVIFKNRFQKSNHFKRGKCAAGATSNRDALRIERTRRAASSCART